MREDIKQSDDDDPQEPPKNLEIYILASAKRMGLSFEELNMFTLNDFLTFIDVWIGEETIENKPRMATQEDIDRFYNSM